jgi:EmrB/QacA subfamily drug resistance transporter
MSPTADSRPIPSNAAIVPGNGEPGATDKIDAYVWRVAGVLILGMMMSILDTTIVNVALHTLSHDLSKPIAQIQWVVTGYLLSLAAVIPVTGWAARRFGAKRIYLISLVLFTAGSAACGLSSSLGELIAFRVLQGVGGGMTMPVAQMIMAQVAGPQRMGKVMGIISMPAMLAPILGPVVGGLILQSLHWSWIFFVNVPIGFLAFTLGWRMIPRTESGEAGSLDVAGIVLLSGGCVGVVYGLSELGGNGSLGSASVIWPVIAGILLIVAFGWHAPRVERPLLDLDLYKSRVFSAASLTTFGLGAALFGAMILVPLYYQEVRHESVIVTGLLNGPQGLGALVAMPLASKLTERFGGGRVALVGVSILCLSTLPLVFVGAHTSIVLISLTLVVRGVSIGLSFMPAMIISFSALRRDQVSDATPQLNVLQRVGGAIGTAILAVVLQRASEHAATVSRTTSSHPAMAELLAGAFRSSYWWALGIAALSLIPCMFLLRAEKPAGDEPVASGQALPPVEAPVEALGL